MEHPDEDGLLLGANVGVPAEYAMLSIDDLLDAEEVFLTNSGWHILPVTAVEQAKIGDGTPGPVTQRLREALLKSML